MFENEAAIGLLAGGRCACPQCTGTLTDSSHSPGGWSFCRICRCAWKVSEIDNRFYATSIHSALHEQARNEKQA